MQYFTENRGHEIDGMFGANFLTAKAANTPISFI